MEVDKQQQTTQRKPWLKRTILGILLGLVLLFVLLPALLYIPVVQDFACRKVVNYLNSSSPDLEYSVGQIRISYPLRLKVNEVDVRYRNSGKTMLHVAKLETGLDDIPIHQPYFVLNRVHVEDIALGMDSLTESFGISGHLRTLEATSLELDPVNTQVRLECGVVSEPDLHLWIGPSVPDSIEEDSPWCVAVKRLVVSHGHVGLDMSDVSLSDAYVAQPVSRYFEYQHMQWSDIDLEVEHVIYEPTLIQADLNLLRGKEQHSGLDLQQLALKFRMEDDVITTHDVDLRLAERDYLRGDMELDFRMFDSIPDGQIQADLQLGIDSLNLFRLAAPWISTLEPYWIAPRAQASLRARLTPDSLEVPHLSLDIPGYVTLAAEGVGSHLLDNEQRSAAANLQGALTHADFLLSAFVDEPTKRTYRLPDSLAIDMDAAQLKQRLTARLDLQQRGRNCLNADVRYDVPTEAYHLTASTSGLNVSDFMPELIADHMTARVEADGRHFRFPGKWTRLDAKLAIDTLMVANEAGHVDRLTALYANASMIGGNYAVDLQSQYPYVQLDGHVEGFFLKDTLSATGFLNVPNLVISRLPFGYAVEGLGDMGVLSKFDVAYDWKDNAHISVRIDSLSYIDDANYMRYDSILLALDSRTGHLDADVVGGDASLCLMADRSIQQLPAVLDTLLAEVNRQYQEATFDFAALQQKLPELRADFTMAQKNPFYQTFEYHTGYTFDQLSLHARNDDRLRLDASITDFMDTTGSIDFDTIEIRLKPQSDDAYAYALHAFHIDPRAPKSYDVHLGGSLMPDSLTVDLNYINGNYQTLYDVMASLALHGDSATLHLEKDPTLYEQPFSVDANNYLSVMKFLHPEERALGTRARMKLQGPRDLMFNLYTRKNPNVEQGNQLLLVMRNLDLGYATRVMQWEGDAGGRGNLTAAINITPDSITANLRSGIKTFHLGDYRADTLSFTGRYEMMEHSNDLNGTLTVDSIVKLRLNAALADSVNVRAWLDELPLPLVNTFLPNYTQLSGTASGEFTLQGKDMESSMINAFATLHDAGLNYNDMDAQLRFSEDTIRIFNSRLLLRDYKLYAANKNPINVRGLVSFRSDVANPSISLNVTGENVRLINNQKLRLKNQYITGRLPISPDIKIRGTLARMEVTGSLGVLSGTNLQYYMSDDPLQSSSQVDQLVDFVSFRHIDQELNSGSMKRRAPMQARQEEGMDINLRIAIDRDVKVTAHLAGVDNNKVDIEGGGDLILATNPRGDLVMTGTYDVTSGFVDYKLPILPVIKTFNISNASNVTWSACTPEDPEIDIIATNEVRTTVNDAQGSRLVRFLVTIRITGTLEALNMTFDCEAPDDGAISSDIASLDADERSKTALMLLVAQTYVGPSNTSSMGLGAANAALNSMLNRQMDSMLGNMKGTHIDVGMDIYNTESGATRTSYSVKVSQNLFNDRFRATIGGEINSGGDVGQSQGAQLSDMSLEWLIKKDGSHYMKVFRRTNYESVLEGELVETGLSYVQERSGYRFRQLLLPTSKKRQQRIDAMIRELRAKEQEEQRQRRRHTSSSDSTLTRGMRHYPDSTSRSSLTTPTP